MVGTPYTTRMRVGIIGTGAISNMHTRALKNIGYELTVCTDVFPEAGKKFADTYGCEFVPTYEELCRHPKVDYVDVCTFPDFRLQPKAIQQVDGYWSAVPPKPRKAY